ncbi:MAG: hypothetical protein U0Q12_22980 [Vicinamibacterales bacterium]
MLAPRVVFTSAAAITALIGGAWIVAPTVLFAAWQIVAPDAIAIYMGRRYGAMFFGYSALFWLTRDEASSPVGRAIAASGVVAASVMAATSAWGAVTGVTGPEIWAVAALEAGLAVVFARAWALASPR